MHDKTSLEISEELRQYIEALVEELALKGKFLESQKKFLSRYCQKEGIEYNHLETKLSHLLEIAEELKTTKSPLLEKYFEITARNCFYSEEGIISMKKQLGKIRDSNQRVSNSIYQNLKERCLKTRLEKEEATRKADKVEKSREQAENRLKEIQKSFERTQQTVEQESEQKAEHDLNDLISKKEKSIQQEAILEIELKAAHQEFETYKDRINDASDEAAGEKRKSLIAILITCLVVAVCFGALLAMHYNN